MKTNVIIAFIVGLILGALLLNWLRPCGDAPTIKDVTVVTRDTIVAPIPPPKEEGPVRKETVKPKKKPQDATKSPEGSKAPTEANTPQDDAPTPQDDAPTITDDGEVEIPIERKTYETEDYKATVEGWRPSLVSMEVYPKTVTRTITKVKTPRFSLTVGPGVGYDGKNFTPNVGVTLGFVLWSK